MDLMFCEQYNHTMDDKGRLTIPTGMREGLAGEGLTTPFYVTTNVWDPDGKSAEKCLCLWPEESFVHLRAQINSLSGGNPSDRQRKRIFFASLQQVLLDKQGRILVRPELKSYAKIEKDVIIMGNNDHVELWDPAVWSDFSSVDLNSGEEWSASLERAGL